MSKLPPVPPPLHSGFNWNQMNGVVIHTFDPNTGVSGAYRCLRPSDFGGTSSSPTFSNVNITGQTNPLHVTGNFSAGSGTFTSGVRMPAAAMSGNSGASGSASPIFTNADNGAIYVQIPNLEKTVDSIKAYPLQGATVATGGRQGVQVGGSGATIFAANTNRNMLFLQNLNTGVLYVSLSGACAINNFNMILKGGALDGGDGGSWSTDTWLGSVSVSGSGGYRITAFEF